MEKKAGLMSFWWWDISNNLFLLNILGELLGYEVYDISNRLWGDPFSRKLTTPYHGY